MHLQQLEAQFWPKCTVFQFAKIIAINAQKLAHYNPDREGGRANPTPSPQPPLANLATAAAIFCINGFCAYFNDSIHHILPIMWCSFAFHVCEPNRLHRFYFLFKSSKCSLSPPIPAHVMSPHPSWGPVLAALAPTHFQLRLRLWTIIMVPGLCLLSTVHGLQTLSGLASSIHQSTHPDRQTIMRICFGTQTNCRTLQV